MNGPRIGSLFSGYGRLDLGAQAVIGGTVAWHVEYDAAPSKILEQHWPTVPNYGDVTTVDWATVEPIDALTAGYPCQPFSIAGKRKGSNDDRHLWPYVLDAIRHLRPRLVILENVRGHLSMGFDRVLGDLAEAGYDAEWVCIPAAAAGAPHRRERIFIAAHAEGKPWSFEHGDDVRVGGRAGQLKPSAGRGSIENSDLESSNQWWLAAPRQEESGRAGADSRGRNRTLAAHSSGDGQRGNEERDSQQSEPQLETSQRLHVDGCSCAVASDSGSERGNEGNDVTGQRGESADWPGVADERGTRSGADQWGKYRPAIARWEDITGRVAPAPTKPDGRDGSHRLSSDAVEFMMGLRRGHVTGLGLTRNEELKALGNGVVPQQAALALSILLGVAA